MFETLSVLLGHITRLFSETSVPGLPDLSFLELYLALLIWSAVTWMFWGFLGQLRSSGYRAGKPKKTGKRGGSANG